MREPRNRVVQVGRFGDPDGLEVVDFPLPTAGQGEVRVRVLASSVQYTDVLIRRHLYPQTAARRPPFVLGYDVVGEIDQLGDCVRGFQVGDRVADLTVVGSTGRLGRSCKSVVTQLAGEGSPPPGLRLAQARLSRKSNELACGGICRFESYMPSQPVSSPSPNSWWSRKARRLPETMVGNAGTSRGEDVLDRVVASR